MTSVLDEHPLTEAAEIGSEPAELHYILVTKIEAAEHTRTSARALCGFVLDDVNPRSRRGLDGVKRKLCVSCEWIHEHLVDGAAGE